MTLMLDYNILLKTFTARKIIYLNTISKIISDAKTRIPALNNKNYKIDGKLYRAYLEGITALKGASLHSSYIRQLQSLEKDGIFCRDKNNILKFTESGLKVVNFFNDLNQFFGEDNFFKFLENTKVYFKKNKTKLIFLYIILEIIVIARYKNVLWGAVNLLKVMIKKKIGYDETEKIKQESLKISLKRLKMPLSDTSLLENLKIHDFKDFIKDIALSLNELPSYQERRQKLIDTINTAFQMLLGENFDKKEIFDFLNLEKTFSEWHFLSLSDRSNVNPLIGFDERLTKILNEESQPIYAIILEKLGKGELIFCSKALQDDPYILSRITNETIEILPLLDHINYAFKTSFTDIKLIEISLPIPYIEQESKSNIYLIPYNKGFFLITASSPLYWHISPPIRKLSISFPEQFNEKEDLYYTYIDEYFFDLKQFDPSTIYYLLRTLELVVDRVYYKRFSTGRIIDDLRKEEGFKSEYHDTYRVNSNILRQGTELNFEKVNTKDDPLYDSEYLCNWAIPRVKIYYDNYFISTGITIEAEKKVYFQVFKAINSPNPIYSKIVKLFANSLKQYPR